MKKTLLILSTILTLGMPLMADGQTLYKNCAGCHGETGQTKGLQVSNTIAGQPSLETIKELTAYKKGELNQYGLGNIMKAQVATLSKEDIEILSNYIATLK